jgi:hypothetical protein
MFAEHLRRLRPRRWVRIANCKGNLRDEGGQTGIGGAWLRDVKTRLTVLKWQRDIAIEIVSKQYVAAGRRRYRTHKVSVSGTELHRGNKTGQVSASNQADYLNKVD